MDHPVDRDLKHLLEGRLGPKGRRRAVRHLLSRCETCPAQLRALIAQGGTRSTSAPDSEEAYDACLTRALAAVRPQVAVWDKEHERKERGIELVRAKGWGNLTSSERRALRGTWARVEMLLDLSFEMRYRN